MSNAELEQQVASLQKSVQGMVTTVQHLAEAKAAANPGPVVVAPPAAPVPAPPAQWPQPVAPQAIAAPPYFIPQPQPVAPPTQLPEPSTVLLPTRFPHPSGQVAQGFAVFPVEVVRDPGLFAAVCQYYDIRLFYPDQRGGGWGGNGGRGDYRPYPPRNYGGGYSRRWGG